MKHNISRLDFELLPVHCHPYDLLGGFTSVLLAVYIPLSVSANTVCEVISSVVAKLQTQQPSPAFDDNWRFPHLTHVCHKSSVSADFHQRKEKKTIRFVLCKPALCECFDATNWDVLRELHGVSIIDQVPN